MCDYETTTRCRLTLKLNEEVRVLMRTIGSVVQTIITTSIIGPSVTAAGRIGLTTELLTMVTSTSVIGAGPPLSDARNADIADGSGNGSLTGSQVGGIVGGAVGCVILVSSAVAFIVIRKKKRRSQRQGSVEGDGAEAFGFRKQEIDGKGLEFIDGCHVELDVKIDAVEVQGVELHHELAGGYGAHGISELEGSPSSFRSSVEKGKR